MNRRSRKAAVILLGALLSRVLVWAVASSFEQDILLYKAGQIAGDRPYCLAVATKDRSKFAVYDAVTARRQLSYDNLTTQQDLALGGSGGPYDLEYYALLVMENPIEAMNWSKTYLSFRSDVNLHQWSIVDHTLPTICTPRKHFSRHLSR